MQRGARVGIIVSLLGIGLDLLIDSFGSRKVISEFLPVLEAFLPIIGVGVLVSVLSYVGFGARNNLRDWAVSHNASVRADLLNLLECSEEVDRLAASLKTAAKPPINLPNMHRFFLLQEKHRGWFPKGMKMGEIKNKAARYSEIFCTYGYIKGRYRIARIERQEKGGKSE